MTARSALQAKNRQVLRKITAQRNSVKLVYVLMLTSMWVTYWHQTVPLVQPTQSILILRRRMQLLPQKKLITQGLYQRLLQAVVKGIQVQPQGGSQEKMAGTKRKARLLQDLPMKPPWSVSCYRRARAHPATQMHARTVSEMRAHAADCCNMDSPCYTDAFTVSVHGVSPGAPRRGAWRRSCRAFQFSFPHLGKKIGPIFFSIWVGPTPMQEKEICHNLGSVFTSCLVYQHCNMCGFISHIVDVPYIVASQSKHGHCIPHIMGTTHLMDTQTL